MQTITYPSMLSVYVAFPPFLLIIFLQHKTAPIETTYKLKKQNKKVSRFTLVMSTFFLRISNSGKLL